MQGVYSNTNIKKLIHDAFVNIELSTAGKTPLAVFVNMLSVLITASFALIPTISEVAILQFSNPSGEKIGAIFCPI